MECWSEQNVREFVQGCLSHFFLLYDKTVRYCPTIAIILVAFDLRCRWAFGMGFDDSRYCCWRMAVEERRAFRVLRWALFWFTASAFMNSASPAFFFQLCFAEQNFHKMGSEFTVVDEFWNLTATNSFWQQLWNYGFFKGRGGGGEYPRISISELNPTPFETETWFDWKWIFRGGMLHELKGMEMLSVWEVF